MNEWSSATNCVKFYRGEIQFGQPEPEEPDVLDTAEASLSASSRGSAASFSAITGTTSRICYSLIVLFFQSLIDCMLA